MAGITIRNLSKNFGENAEVAAVSDLNIEIKDNSFVTLLGPSGCGKTTTLRLIAGYIVPDHGSIDVAGRTLSSPAGVVPPESRGMGMVFQNYAIWPHKTVFQNVVFGLKLRRVPAAEARRKVAETLALVVAPDILLLDEPLSNLDAKLRERMRVELKELQRRTRITFVYVTHDQAEALALSDQIAVTNAGRVQQFGAPFDVYARPANRMVADFMGLVNLVPGTVREVHDGSATVSVGGLAVAGIKADGLSAGDDVDLSIRPEHIRLGFASGAPAGGRARVTKHAFLRTIR